MTREVKHVQKESFLNSIFRHKRSKDFTVLYFSKWDDKSVELISYLEEKWVEGKGDEIIYLVNSFELPHSFMAYSVTQVPCLVQGLKGKIRKTEYLPYIYKALLPNQGRNA